MTRLLVDGVWYDALASNAYWENEYERLILEHAPKLYPDYIAIPFKPTVQSELGVAKPDLALIDPEYRVWWVVEVELAHHSLSGHVLPQVTVLATAEYGASIADYIASQPPYLDRTQLGEMMKGAQPRVLVVVNGATNWRRELSPYSALLAVVEIFRSSANHHILHTSGDYPEKPPPVVSRCRLDPMMPRLLVVESPALIDTDADGRVYIEYEGRVTIWEPVGTKDRFWLSPIQTGPLPPGVTFVIVKGEDGRLSIRPEKG